MRTRVYLTVDVECAEEQLRGGRIVPPIGYDIFMWGKFSNQREDLGIGLIMRELKKRGFSATFFVEPLGSVYFGLPGLTEVCKTLRELGQDIQLHPHPVMRNVTHRSGGGTRHPDDIGLYPEAEQVEILRAGKTILTQAGVNLQDILAFRAGNFGASNSTWSAMEKAGLTVSSNYNPCYFENSCKMRFPRAEAGLFPSPVKGVWELPITCFEEKGVGVKGSKRHLQISAVSLRETIECLQQSRALGVEEVLVFTHSFEFFVIDSLSAKRGHPNRLNVKRLQGLLEFLHQNPKDFEVETVGALAKRLAAGVTPSRSPKTVLPTGKPSHRYGRLAQQAFKRVANRFSF